MLLALMTSAPGWIKKRIDKASEKPTVQRLAAPGKIAIIYDQRKQKRIHAVFRIPRVHHQNIETLDVGKIYPMQMVEGVEN